MALGQRTSLLLVVAAGILGVTVGYYVAMSDTLPVSWGVLVMIGLVFGAVLTAFHGGRASSIGTHESTSSRSWDMLRLELDRSRRFERSFVLMHLPRGDKTDSSSHGSTVGGLDTLSLMLRDIDQAWEVDGGVYAVLPETNRAAAAAVIERLRSSSSLDGEIDGIQIAAFPEDGVTAGALLDGLRAVPARDELVPVRLMPARTDGERRRDTRTG